MGNTVYDNNDNLIYLKSLGGYWEKYDYDSNGNEIYFENSNGKQIHYII